MKALDSFFIYFPHQQFVLQPNNINQIIRSPQYFLHQSADAKYPVIRAFSECRNFIFAPMNIIGCRLDVQLHSGDGIVHLPANSEHRQAPCKDARNDCYYDSLEYNLFNLIHFIPFYFSFQNYRHHQHDDAGRHDAGQRLARHGLANRLDRRRAAI
jgi:hypothetical protein